MNATPFHDLRPLLGAIKALHENGEVGPFTVIMASGRKPIYAHRWFQAGHFELEFYMLPVLDLQVVVGPQARTADFWVAGSDSIEVERAAKLFEGRMF